MKKTNVMEQKNVTGKLRTNVRSPLRYSIGFRFIGFVMLAVAIAGAGVSLVVLSTSREHLRQQALNDNLNQANLAAAFASNYIEVIEAHVEVFARRPDVRQAVLNGTLEELQTTLAQFVQIQAPLNGVGVYDTNGIQLTYSLANSATIGQSFSDRNWFQGVMATGKSYLGIPILSKANNIPVETYAVPILDEQGQIRAVLSAGISLQKLSDALVNIGFTSDTEGRLVDLRDGGLIIADKDPLLLLTQVTGNNQAISSLMAGNSGSLEITDSAGKQVLTGFSPVAGLPWGIIVVTPSNTALAIINTLTQRASIYAGLIVILSGIFGVFLVLGIIRPLSRLVQDTREIGNGNMDVKLGPMGKDEIGNLSRSFGEMAVKLKTTMVSRDDLIKEVAERKQAEEALIASEARYRRFFEAARDGILILDVETGTVVDVNPFMVELLGFSREEFLNKKIWELGFFKDIIANQDHFEELKRNKYVTYENMPLETASGQRIQVEFVSYCYEVGNHQVIQCNIRNITERKRLEREKEKFTQELAEKNTELERFTYTVSHDLKSPLVTVKTFLGYLKHDIAAADPPLIEKDMFFMNSAADKMGKLLEELLEMSRVGRIANLPVKVTFDELVEDTLSITAGRIEEKGVQVRLHKEPVTLCGDRTRLVEIWQNLVENAVKFMGDQPAPQIDIGVEWRENGTVFFVRDNGIGIEPRYQSKLFNLFEKINPKTEGTGMGLAITKRIVELYQGKIWVESKGPGEGTCFFFTLPGALKDKESGV